MRAVLVEVEEQLHRIEVKDCLHHSTLASGQQRTVDVWSDAGDLEVLEIWVGTCQGTSQAAAPQAQGSRPAPPIAYVRLRSLYVAASIDC